MTYFRKFYGLYSIDATTEPLSGRRLGRLVNHSKKGTAYPRLISVMDEPHLCLFASRSLEPGEQVLYNYGVELPFRDLVCNCCYFWFITYKLVSGNTCYSKRGGQH